MTDERIKATSYLDKLAFVQGQYSTVQVTWLIVAFWLAVLGFVVAPWGPGNWVWAVLSWVGAVGIALFVYFWRRRIREAPLPAATPTLERLILPPLVLGIILAVIIALVVAAVVLRDRWTWLPSLPIILWVGFALVTVFIPGLVLPFQQDSLLRRRLDSDPQFRNKVELVSARYRADSQIPFSEKRLTKFDGYWLKEH